FGVTGAVLIANRRFLQDTQISPDWPLEYSARDQLLEAGEGHTTTTLFDATAMPISQIDAAGNRQTGRLIGISARTAEGIVLQNLTYEHDPVGNIVRLEDLSAASSAARNTKADPASLYRYDSLYQLVEATGREVNTGFSHGPALPDEQPLLPDANQLTNYTQTYTYD
nr:hypothetical protein [Tanacetum cinerariifolium]